MGVSRRSITYVFPLACNWWVCHLMFNLSSMVWSFVELYFSYLMCYWKWYHWCASAPYPPFFFSTMLSWDACVPHVTCSYVLTDALGIYYRCSFMNFSRNIRCLKCKAEGPKRVSADEAEMKKGDWTCRQYVSYSSCPAIKIICKCCCSMETSNALYSL